MGKYFILQWKRVLRYLPAALCVMALLLGGLLAALQLTVQQDEKREENNRFPVAICGQAEDDFLQMGLTVISTLDSSRYALDIRQMEEKDAQKALEMGEISAYVVIPEGFTEAASAGEMIPLKMVSTTGQAGLVSMFKEELTLVIGDLLACSEQGVFGMESALREQRIPVGTRLDNLALEYVDHILVRNRMYRLEEMGIADRLGLREYLLCGLSVLFSMLACLPFAPLQIRPDHALEKLLRAKGYGAMKQTLCDFGAYALTLLVIGAALLPALHLMVPVTLSSVLRGIPVVLLVAAYSFLLFTLSRDLMSGVLLQFFLTIGLCFVCGCIYPTHFFPVAVQKIAAWLPAGLARTQLAGCFTGELTGTTLPILGYTAVFLAISVYVKHRRIRGVAV